MIKAILNSLKNSAFEFNSNALIKFKLFEPAIPNSGIYLMYSLKFELNRNKFKGYLKEIIESLDIFNHNDSFLDEVIEISHKWYIFYLDNKTLFSATNSLKSDLKKSYKKRIPDLKGFDRFYEKIYNTFIEAYNVYTVVFYNTDAVQHNENFAPDRNSCYINERLDYLRAIRQTNSYYVIIYKNDIPVTRVWFVCDETYENAIIFNPYGHKFRNLSKFFGDQNEFTEVNRNDISKLLYFYVNDDIILSTTHDYNLFSYRLDDIGYKLICQNYNDMVYSKIYKAYIPKILAVYSKYYDSYLTKRDATFSYYLQDYLYRDIKCVYNFDIDNFDYVPSDCVVESKEYTYVIKDQVVFSTFYDDYVPKKYAVYCDQVDSYIDKHDDKFIQLDGKFVMKSQDLVII